MMTGDIPAAVMEKLYGDNAADIKKEDGKKSEPENRSESLPYPTKWKIPVYLPVKKYRPRSSGRKHAGKGTACRNIPNICLTTML